MHARSEEPQNLHPDAPDTDNEAVLPPVAHQNGYSLANTQLERDGVLAHSFTGQAQLAVGLQFNRR